MRRRVTRRSSPSSDVSGTTCCVRVMEEVGAQLRGDGYDFEITRRRSGRFARPSTSTSSSRARGPPRTRSGSSRTRTPCEVASHRRDRAEAQPYRAARFEPRGRSRAGRRAAHLDAVGADVRLGARGPAGRSALWVGRLCASASQAGLLSGRSHPSRRHAPECARRRGDGGARCTSSSASAPAAFSTA